MKEDIDQDETRQGEREEPKVVTRDGVQPRRRERERSDAPERESAPARLFEGDRATDLQRRWTDVQARFVDDPREAVKAADGLVDEVIRDLSTLFSDERSGLESHWSRNEEVSTEDLRQALRRYRSFFERLLSI